MVTDLENLGCHGVKLSEIPGNGCKPRGYNTAREILIDRKIDKKDELERKIEEAEKELEKIVETITKMPTKKYSDILIQKYVTKTKVTKQISGMRYRHLYDAYLEFYHTWENKE